MSLKLPKQRKFEFSASYIKRLISYVVDLIIVFGFLATPLASAMPHIKGLNFDITPELSATIFAVLVVTFGYFHLMQLYVGRTLGLMLFGIKLKGKINTWNSFKRALFLMPTFPFYFIWIIEPFWISFYKVSILDKISNIEMVQEVYG